MQQKKKPQTNFEHKTRVRHGASTLQTHLYIYIYIHHLQRVYVVQQYNSCHRGYTFIYIYIYTPFTTSVCSTIVQLMSQRIHFYLYIYTHHLQRVYVVQQYNSCHRGYTFLLKCLYQARKVSRYVFVLRVSILILSTIFLLDFGTVSTMWYFLFFIHWLSNF